MQLAFFAVCIDNSVETYSIFTNFKTKNYTYNLNLTVCKPNMKGTILSLSKGLPLYLDIPNLKNME